MEDIRDRRSIKDQKEKGEKPRSKKSGPAPAGIRTSASPSQNGVEPPSSSPAQKLITSTTKLIPTFKSSLNPHINPERE